MKKYVIDTNVLISFVTDRNLNQQESVTPLFTAASKSKASLICHQFALTEFVFVMDKVYQTPQKMISTMICDFINMPGVQVIQETDFKAVFSLWPEKIRDFGDAVVASAGMATKGAVFVTFDSKFRTALKSLGQTVYQN